jgi:hypothetical protein
LGGYCDPDSHSINLRTICQVSDNCCSGAFPSSFLMCLSVFICASSLGANLLLLLDQLFCGCIDFILSPEDIAGEIVRIARAE